MSVPCSGHDQIFLMNDRYLSHSFHQSTFHLSIITTDNIITNLPLNEISSPYDISHLSFALLHEYECRSIDMLQLCLPMNLFHNIDLYSYIFNNTFNTIQVFESYFSRSFPLNRLTLVTVLELNNRFLSKPGLVFIDQNALLTNISAEQIIHQHELIFLIVAHQWIDVLIQVDKNHQWIGKGLARSLAMHLFNTIYDPMGNNNHSQIERFMSTIVMDSLCNIESVQEVSNVKSENILIEKGEALLTELRLTVGDVQFHSRIQQLIQESNSSFLNESMLSTILFTDSSLVSTWAKLPGHPIVFHNPLTIDIHLFKFNPNCSTSISSKDHLLISSNLSLNPFVHIFHPSWNRLLDELRTFRQQQQPINSFSRLLFDSFVFNLANQLSIEYPLQLISFFFQQSSSSLTKNDLILVNKILHWYRSIFVNSLLEEKFVIYLRKLLNPFCLNHLWTKSILIDVKHSHQQIINDILLELCCSVNHSICLQQISNRNDPQILLQFILNNHRFDLTTTKSMNASANETDMLTSFNQLQVPALFIYPDAIITSMTCQLVRQQTDKYWYEFISLIQQKFQYQVIPWAFISGLSCAIRTTEQVDFYLNHLCPPSPFKWPCYRNILTYSSMKDFEQLKTIDEDQWPMNIDERVDFFFHTSVIQGNFSSHPTVLEFQSIIFTWLTTNQYKLSQWLDNDNS